MSREDDEKRYFAALHAMQTGVAYDLQHNPSSGTPKHLRVGINSAMVGHGALVKLLLEKGIFTEEEYIKAIADGMECERDKYQETVSKQFGGKVTLA